MMKKLTTALLGAMLAAASLGAMACMEVSAAQTPSASSPEPCGSEAPQVASAETMLAEVQSAPQYVIGGNDVISIAVDPDVAFLEGQKCSRDYTVPADGRINFCGLPSPPMAAGLTASALADHLKKLLIESKMYTDVSVTVEVKDFRSQKVYITGPVKTAGELELKGTQMTITRAVNAAGGWAANAGSDVWLLRPPPGIDTAVTLDDTRAEKKRYSRRLLMENMIDPPIQAGDTIYVSTAEVIYINGEVKSFGEKVWQPCMTVGDAIAKASGLQPAASLRRSHILRKNPAKNTYDKISGLKLETLVEPADIINIGKKLF